MSQPGADCSVVVLKRGNARGAKGAGYSRHDQLANWQQEEPNGYGGGRQLSVDGTSRVTGDCHARICERLGVKFPGPTRRLQSIEEQRMLQALSGNPRSAGKSKKR